MFEEFPLKPLWQNPAQDHMALFRQVIMRHPQFTPGEWSLEYLHGTPGLFRIKAGGRLIVDLSTQQNKEESAANAHLIAAAPLLYQALTELLISTEEALIAENIGCECNRCDRAKQASYRAIGLAEGKTTLKEGDPRSY